MRIAIIGAGPAGLAAAYDLTIGGHQVTVFEAAARVGGLAAGFKDAAWDWELEKFYHHWFQTDHDMLQLIAELGWSDQVLFPRPKTSIWIHGKTYQLDSAISALLFPLLPIIPKIRFGFTTLYLRLTQNWRSLEKFTAEEWYTRFLGKAGYEALWRPLLIGKFSDLYQDVTMAWFWARLHTRTTHLGTFQGGFQRFLDMFAERLAKMGVTICVGSPVQNVQREGDTLKVTVADQVDELDAVISTVSPSLTLKIAPQLTGAYADKLRKLQSIGAVIVILALKHQLLTDGTYWLNLPAESADRDKNEAPFLALVEHTNYMDAAHYGGDHIIYCGDYIPADHAYFKLTDEELMLKFTAALKTFNPAFSPDWIRKYWVFRAPYAQPVPFVNHSQNIPDTRTPIPGFYMANMSQIYPYDRGTNYAVQIGRKVAKEIMSQVNS